MTGFTSLTISTVRLPVRPERMPILLGDAVAGRQVGWDIENTIHKNVVADNLSELARYIAGLSLLQDIRLEDAQVVLGPLLSDVKTKYRQKRLPIEVRRFIGTISEAYVISLIEGVKKKYLDELARERIFQLSPQSVRAWEEKLKEALKIQGARTISFVVARYSEVSFQRY